MHNWRLLILLIPSLLQPILSEHSLIDGRQCCVHSTRTLLPDGRSLQEKRLAKTTTDGNSLVNQRSTDQSVNRRYRYDIKDVEPTPFSNERRLQRNVFASDERNRIINIRGQRTVKDVSRNIQRQIVREENARETTTSLHARLSREDREREGRKHAEYRFDTRLRTRLSHIRHRRQHVRNNDAVTRNVRQIRLRQNYQDLSPQTNIDSEKRFLDSRFIVPDENKNTADSFEQNIRKRDMTRDSIRDSARTGTPIGLKRERANIRSVERKLHNIIRERTVSVERYMARSDERRFTNERVARNREEINTEGSDETYSRDKIRKRSVSVERQVLPSDKRKNLNTRNLDNYEETNRNKRNIHTNVRNERFSRNNINNRDNSVDRDVYQPDVSKAHNDITRVKRTNIRNGRTEIRNAERYMRDNTRDRTLDQDIRQNNARRISGRYLTRTHVEPNTRIKYERSAKNTERLSRNNTPNRLINVDREVRKSKSRMVLDTSNAHSHKIQNTNEYMNLLRNDERYSRDSIRERTVSDERDIRQSESRSVSKVQGVHGIENLSRNVRYDRAGIRDSKRYSNRERDVSVERVKHQRNGRITMNLDNTNVRAGNADIRDIRRYLGERSVPHLNERRILHSEGIISYDREDHNKNVRSDIRKGERYSSERAVLNEREIRISDERNTLAIKREKRNTVRDERTDTRNNGRYAKDYIQERTMSLNRDVPDAQRVKERHPTRNRQERNLNPNHERNGVRNDQQYSRDITRERSLSMDREVRESDKRRIMDVQNRRSSEERNRDMRNKRSDIRNDERYLRHAIRQRSLERNEDSRQRIAMRIYNEQRDRDSEDQSIVRKEHNTYFNDREIREINSRRLLLSRNLAVRNRDSYSRKRKIVLGDFINEITLRNVELNTRNNDRKIRASSLPSNEHEKARFQIRNTNSLITYPRSTHISKISSEQSQERDFIRLSSSRISDARTITALRAPNSDLYREREANNRKKYGNSKNYNYMHRNYVTGAKLDFTKVIRTLDSNKALGSSSEPKQQEFNKLFQWQYLFYAVQAIYILGVLLQVYKEKDISKTSSVGWLTSSRLIKVD